VGEKDDAKSGDEVVGMDQTFQYGDNLISLFDIVSLETRGGRKAV
jgi:hypothetical protein